VLRTLDPMCRSPAPIPVDAGPALRLGDDIQVVAVDVAVKIAPADCGPTDASSAC
jgi:hypothetical protein